MSNTYFEIDTTDTLTSKKESATISLTAYVGGEKLIQLSVGRTGENYPFSFIGLTHDEAVKLAGALLERTNGIITATGSERTNFNTK